MGQIQSLVINTGAGNDEVKLKSANTLGGTGISVFGPAQGLSIDTGSGNDRLELIAANTGDAYAGIFVSTLFINTDSGNDDVELLAKNSSGGELNDGIVTSGLLSINTGAGNDHVSLKAKNNGPGTIGIFFLIIYRRFRCNPVYQHGRRKRRCEADGSKQRQWQLWHRCLGIFQYRGRCAGPVH